MTKHYENKLNIKYVGMSSKDFFLSLFYHVFLNRFELENYLWNIFRSQKCVCVSSFFELANEDYFRYK